MQLHRYLTRLLASSALGLCAFATPALAQADLNAAVLPGARSGEVGDTLTVFATISNSGDATALNCSIAFDNTAPGSFSASLTYQTTDVNNALTGSADTPVDIPAGSSQGFVVGITPNAEIDPGQDIALSYSCNSVSAPRRYGVNTVFIRAVSGGGSGTPDVIPILQTLSGDGIVALPDTGTPRQQIFVAAASNIGAGGSVQVTPVFSRLKGAAQLLVCETTGSGDGSCLPGSPFAETLTTTIPGLGLPPATFTGIAVLEDGTGIEFRPDLLRAGLVFTDPNNGSIVGRTDAAIRANGPATQGQANPPAGIYMFEVQVDGEEEQPPSEEQSFLIVDPAGFIEGVTLESIGSYTDVKGRIEFDSANEPGSATGVDIQLCDEGTCSATTFNGIYQHNNRILAQVGGEIPGQGPFTSEFYGSYTRYSNDPVDFENRAGLYDIYEMGDVTMPIGSVNIAANGFISGDVTVPVDDVPTQCTLSIETGVQDPSLNFFNVGASLDCGGGSEGFGGVGARLPWVLPAIGPAPSAYYVLMRDNANPDDSVALAFVPQ